MRKLVLAFLAFFSLAHPANALILGASVGISAFDFSISGARLISVSPSFGPTPPCAGIQCFNSSITDNFTIEMFDQSSNLLATYAGDASFFLPNHSFMSIGPWAVPVGTTDVVLLNTITVFGGLPFFGADLFITTDGQIPAVPEPSTWAMLLIGFAGIGFVGFIRKGSITASWRNRIENYPICSA